MSKEVTIEQYMNMLSEKVVDNTRQLKKSVHQRRNGMEDLYGVCFTANATLHSGVYRARFYVSLSPDYVYLHRFAFKFVIMPSIVEDEDPSEGRDWKVLISGNDITAYLKEQQDIDPSDPLFNGEGIYPNNKLDETDTVENFYDILDVVSVMIAEDTDETLEMAEAIMKPYFKPVDITSKKPFSVDAYLYLKYSTVNR